ncbi:hypothetical protein ACU4GH_35600 [Bradyrhizobium betae]
MVVAFSASGLVCSAIEVISLTTSPMRAPASESWAMRWSVASACCTRLGGNRRSIPARAA